MKSLYSEAMNPDKTQFTTSPGFPEPLGNKRLNNGVHFAVYSKTAINVVLCLFLEDQINKITLNPKENKTGDIWHIFIHDLPNFVKYAYCIDDQPQFLLDPFAKAVFRKEVNSAVLFLGVVGKETAFDWQGVKSPDIPMKDLIIYEMHVRGFTVDPSSHVQQKGSFLGIIEKIPHLLQLGINAVELMPVHAFNEKEYIAINPISDQQLCNYWGYSPLNFFALHTIYATSVYTALAEFKTLVRELHRNGIEIILDVVFNHTGEGNNLGPTISFKGFENAVYYILDDKKDYENYSGCGNTFNCNHPVAAHLILEALRYFVIEMHVDGFRFDLASILARDQTGHPFKHAPIIDFISQDPLLSHTKLIAEPWDAAGYYLVGSFYPNEIRWSEWNDRYRDTCRAFLGGIRKNPGKFTTRLCGSEDLYYKRAPYSSINFITSHDGFTLYDLVSYNQKHNMENGEDNQDGSNYNLSWNCGTEGPTLNPEIHALRERQMKNFHFALMISQGVPLILMGDEYGHTKKGNNNSWCQDNEINWFKWDLLNKNLKFYRFYCKVIALRRQYSIFRKGFFLTDRDISWHGTSPYSPRFDADSAFIAFTLIGSNESFYIAFNAREETLNVELPLPPANSSWYLVVDTANSEGQDFIDPENRTPLLQEEITMLPFSAVCFIAQ